MSNFNTPKYQAVIAATNSFLNAGVEFKDVRKAVIKLRKELGGLKYNGEVIPMSEPCCSTYYANVTEHLRAAAPKVTTVQTVQVVGVSKKDVHSIVSFDGYNVATAVEYFEDDSYLDVDTTGRKIVQGYQVVGQKVGVTGPKVVEKKEVVVPKVVEKKEVVVPKVVVQAKEEQIQESGSILILRHSRF